MINSSETATSSNEEFRLRLQEFLRRSLYIADFFLILFSWGIASYLSLNSEHFSQIIHMSAGILPVLYLPKLFFAVRFGLYRALLKYASLHFAITIIKAVSVGSIVAYISLELLYPGKIPFRLFALDWLFTLSLVGFVRFFPRIYLETSKDDSGKKRVLIYGAGDVADALTRSILNHQSEYVVVGFIDDDPKKIYRKLHNLPILGSRENLVQILKKHRIDGLLIAITQYPTESLRELVKLCRQQHIFCRLAPKIPDMLNYDVQIKQIDIADLLKRDPKDLDENQISRFLKGKKILITGAAGSIGSELVRQALRFNPLELTLVDSSELGLYQLQEELASTHHSKIIRYSLLNLCNSQLVDLLIQETKPDLIFHAAAYKHVPLVEQNPVIGARNNIQGTINVANAADRFQVEKMVLISTDKAVRPTNVMGATKRVCELYIQNLNLRSKTEYVAVRFGNVLGSSGSVIPKFLEQIRQGGPVTVTHPDVTRYFMLVQEAVELAMQAASIGHGGEIFILNMGKPVKIKEMAEDLIFLAGKQPYTEVDIQFTGLRPGEKLYEELLIDETEKKTQYENITIGKMTFIDWKDLNDKISNILNFTQDRASLLKAIWELVPEFKHVDLPAEYQQASNVVSLYR